MIIKCAPLVALVRRYDREELTRVTNLMRVLSISGLLLSILSLVIVMPGRQTKLQRLLKHRLVATLLCIGLIAIIVSFFVLKLPTRAVAQKYKEHPAILNSHLVHCGLPPYSKEAATRFLSFTELPIAIFASLLTGLLIVRVVLLWCPGASLDFEQYRKRPPPYVQDDDEDDVHTPDLSTRPTSVPHSRFHSISTDHSHFDHRRRSDSSVTQPPPCVLDLDSSDEDSYWLSRLNCQQS